MRPSQGSLAWFIRFWVRSRGSFRWFLPVRQRKTAGVHARSSAPSWPRWSSKKAPVELVFLFGGFAGFDHRFGFDVVRGYCRAPAACSFSVCRRVSSLPRDLYRAAQVIEIVILPELHVSFGQFGSTLQDGDAVADLSISRLRRAAKSSAENISHRFEPSTPA